MSSFTATQLAYRALRDIGCLRAGQSTSTDILNDLLEVINERIDADLINPGLRIQFAPLIFTLQLNTESYSIGPGATFNSPRPTGIEAANIILTTVTPPVRQPVHVVRDVREWSAIRLRAATDTAGSSGPITAIPLELYYDKGFVQASGSTAGWGIIYLWPVPVATYSLELFVWSQLTQFPDLVTTVNWPPGYAEYLRKSVAVSAAPSMYIYSKLGRLSEPKEPMIALVKEQAEKALADLEAYNAETPLLGYDPMYRTDGKGMWNYGIGDTVVRGD